MMAHAHQSLSAGCVTVTAAGSLRAARRSFATAFLLGRDSSREQVGLSRLACIPETGDLGGVCGESKRKMRLSDGEGECMTAGGAALATMGVAPAIRGGRAPSNLYRVWGSGFLHFRPKSFLAYPVRFLRSARASFSAPFQRPRNSCVACLLRLSMSRTCAMCSSSSSRSRKERGSHPS
jgi:hypothetical protein